MPCATRGRQRWIMLIMKAGDVKKKVEQIEILRRDYLEFISVSFCVDGYNCNHEAQPVQQLGYYHLQAIINNTVQLQADFL